MNRKSVAAILVLSLAAALALAADTARATFAIKGMTCGGCVAAVKLRLKGTDGVTAYDVSLQRGDAVVRYDPARTEPKKIAASISKSGFQATVKEEPSQDGRTRKP